MYVVAFGRVCLTRRLWIADCRPENADTSRGTNMSSNKLVNKRYLYKSAEYVAYNTLVRLIAAAALLLSDSKGERVKVRPSAKCPLDLE